LLATKLAAALAPKAIRISMDDFYLDRSHLPPARRAQINFDHPRGIDWAALLRALRALCAGRTARLPRYDFSRHCRLSMPKLVRPKSIILLDGLWVLHRPRYAACPIFGFSSIAPAVHVCGAAWPEIASPEGGRRLRFASSSGPQSNRCIASTLNRRSGGLMSC
jgi:pantothenate kinase